MTQRLSTWLLMLAIVWGAAGAPWHAWALQVAEPGDFRRQVVPATATPAASAPHQAPGLDAADPVVQVLMSQVTSPTLRQYVGDLSGEWPVLVGGEPYTITTRMTDSGEPIAKAVQWAGEHLAGLGMNVTEHVWQAGRPPNVIAELIGSTAPHDVLILSAHLDSITGEAIAPGADDNASGAAAVLAAADVLSSYAWRCTLRFALWTGEEQGLLGSREYAQQAAQAGAPIRGVLNLDMIGWNTPGTAQGSPDIDLHATATVPASVEMANLFADVVEVYDLDLIPQVVTVGIRGSDHASFWDNNYPAIMAIEDYYPQKPDFNPYYHTPADRLDKLDLAYFTAISQASLGAFVHMSDCLVTGALNGHVAWSASADPASGAAIAATNAAGHTFTASADAAGAYSLTLPAGIYTVTATALGAPPVAVENLVIDADALTTQDFTLGCYGLGSIGEAVWLDDGDGQPEQGEPGLPNVLLRLADSGPDAVLGTADDGDHGVTWTDPTGKYSFTCLPPGAYRVQIDPASPGLAGLLLVYPDSSGQIDFPLAAGEVYTAANFGYRNTTAVQVLSFQMRRQPGATDLSWQVLLDGAAAPRFHVLRSQPGSVDWQQVTQRWLTPAAHDGQIARYQFIDRTEPSPARGQTGGVVYYALRGDDGVFYGPWSSPDQAGRRLFLPVITLGGR